MRSPIARSVGHILLATALLCPAVHAGAQDAAWPALDAPLERTGVGGRDAAVVVAVGDYTELPDLPGARENSRAWADYLSKVRGVPHVTVLTDAEVTRDGVFEAARAAAGAVKRGGTVFFVWIGHGASGPDGPMLVTADARADASHLVDRGVALSALLPALGKGRTHQTVVIADTNFAGRVPTGSPLAPGLGAGVAPRAHKRTALFTAAAPDQRLGPLPGTARPALSYLLLGALRGWGDLDGDGTVTAQEARDYAAQMLALMVVDRRQTPVLTASDPGVALSVGAREQGPDPSRVLLGGDTGPYAKGDLALTTYFLCERKRGAGYEALEYCDGATLTEGDRFKVGFRVDAAAHLYFYMFNDRNQFQMFFPDPGVDNRVLPGRDYVIPPGDQWATLDDVSGVTEQLHLVASRAPLPALEALRGKDLPPLEDGAAHADSVDVRGKLNPLVTRGKLDPVLTRGKLNPILTRGKLNPVLSRGKLDPVLSRGKLDPLITRDGTVGEAFDLDDLGTRRRVLPTVVKSAGVAVASYAFRHD